jgi:hypothetical protein
MIRPVRDMIAAKRAKGRGLPRRVVIEDYVQWHAQVGIDAQKRGIQ